MSSLMIAIDSGSLSVVKLLLEEQGILEQPHQKDKMGKNTLMIASAKGRVDFVKLLDIDSSRELIRLEKKRGRSALPLASEAGHFDVVKLLIEADSSPSISIPRKATTTTRRQIK